MYLDFSKFYRIDDTYYHKLLMISHQNNDEIYEANLFHEHTDLENWVGQSTHEASKVHTAAKSV